MRSNKIIHREKPKGCHAEWLQAAVETLTRLSRDAECSDLHICFQQAQRETFYLEEQESLELEMC